jgi:carbonic anhydrase
MESYRKLLLSNQAWAKELTELNPEYFSELAKGQQPEFLWIGCSDSRVPAEEITGARPGELFVHRNIANMVVHTDLNLLSVVKYAVDYLKVKQIIICGHYGCGGVQAAMSNTSFDLLNNWLRHIKDVYCINQQEIESLSPEERFDRMVELNIIEQARNLAKTSIIQAAWQRESRPVIHGWAFQIKTGLIKPLTQIGPNSKDLPAIFQLK